MLDIEILEGKHSLWNSVLYEFDTSAFKVEIINHIKKYFSSRGIQLREVEYERFLSSFLETSIFGESLVIVDLNRAKEIKGFDKILVNLAERLVAKSVPNRYFFLYKISEKDSFLEDDSYKSIKKSSTFIQEVTVTKSTLSKLIKYLITKNKDIYTEEIKNLGVFKSSLEDMVKKGDVPLTEFIRKFESFLILCIEDGIFDVLSFKQLMQEDESVDYFLMHKLFFNFLLTPTADLKSRIMVELNSQYNQQQVPLKMIIASFFRVLKDFMLSNKILNPSGTFPPEFSKFKIDKLKAFSNLPLSVLYKYNLYLIKYEPEFNSKNFLVVLNSFLSDFVLSI